LQVVDDLKRGFNKDIEPKDIFEMDDRNGFKASDQVQGQGVPQIVSGAYTQVREHFNLRDNAAIEPEMGF